VLPKVAMVAHWDWVLHRFRLPLARALRDRGCEVVLVCPRGRYSPRFRNHGLPWVEWRVNRRSVNPLRELAAIARLAGIYRRQRPDLVHHFTVKPNLHGTVAARLTGTPLTVNTFTGLGFVFSDSRSASPLRSATQPLMRWAFRSPRVWTIGLNAADLERLKSLGLASPTRARLVPDGVDTDAFEPAPSGNDVPVVLFASRLVHDKGVAELVAATDLLRRRGVPVRLRIAGETDPGNPTTISAEEVGRWAARPHVEVLGHRDDMPEVYDDSDVAALPSYHEGLPRFLLEAAATGLPLVASDIPGCRDVVRDGVNGFLVPPADTGALADALEKLCRDAQLRARLGAAARRTALEAFPEQRSTERYLELYRELGVVS
jgi:glycosyltransferase involved in cell wall biosynthesis